ncbi:hypothetical protein CL619_02805, partial [archaeon]|nr:hypothetical protein [archaeon]
MVKLILNKKPKGVRIIEGFPGFGLIGTIVSEFLLDHLETEQVGFIEMDEVPAMIAIHNSKVIQPISLHYNKKYNLLLVHAINPGKGLEWKLADALLDLAKQLSAKEMICLEGVGAPNSKERVFYLAQNVSANRLKVLKKTCEPLQEGVIVGVTGALLTKRTNIPLLALFAEAQGNGPDSNAAAEIITALDAFVGFSLDPEPLHQKAKLFEGKLKD